VSIPGIVNGQSDRSRAPIPAIMNTRSRWPERGRRNTVPDTSHADDAKNPPPGATNSGCNSAHRVVARGSRLSHDAAVVLHPHVGQGGASQMERRMDTDGDHAIPKGTPVSSRLAKTTSPALHQRIQPAEAIVIFQSRFQRFAKVLFNGRRRPRPGPEIPMSAQSRNNGLSDRR
jgi:hypothetical protein